MSEFNGYNLSRGWFNFAFQNPEKINPNHAALYLFIVEHCNRLGWRAKFGLPTMMTMEAIGIRNYRTFAKTFHDLIEWGFIELVEKSKNQYSTNIIAIVKNTEPNTEAHTEPNTEAHTKASPKQVQSIVDIIKPIKLNETTKPLKRERAPAKKSNAIDIEQARAYYRQLWYDARDTAPDAIGWVEAIGKTIKDDNLDAVLCMPDPIRLSDVIIWRKQYDIEDLKQIIREMENSNLLHKYKSCRLTANNWLKRQSK